MRFSGQTLKGQGHSRRGITVNGSPWSSMQLLLNYTLGRQTDDGMQSVTWVRIIGNVAYSVTNLAGTFGEVNQH